MQPVKDSPIFRVYAVLLSVNVVIDDDFFMLLNANVTALRVCEPPSAKRRQLLGQFCKLRVSDNLMQQFLHCWTKSICNILACRIRRPASVEPVVY